MLVGAAFDAALAGFFEAEPGDEGAVRFFGVEPTDGGVPDFFVGGGFFVVGLGDVGFVHGGGEAGHAPVVEGVFEGAGDLAGGVAEIAVAVFLFGGESVGVGRSGSKVRMFLR